VYVILRVVDNLKAILAPTLCVPHTPVLTHRTQKLHEYLGYNGQPFDSAQGRLFGTQHMVEYQEETRSHQALTYDHTGAVGTWATSELPAGQPLRQPAPLFKKLDESVIEEEYARLAG
jgi:methionyl-tRNA synthetase